MRTWLIALMLVVPMAAQADTVFWLNGRSVEKTEGTIVQESDGKILLRTIDGRELEVFRRDIVNIIHSNKTRSVEDTSPTILQSDIGRNRGSRVLFYGYVGFGTQALGDINDGIKEEEAALQEAGADVSFDTFGGAPDFGGGVTVKLTSLVGLGLQFGYQGNKVEAEYRDSSGFFTDATHLRIMDLTGSIEFSVPTVRGLFVGANAGVGFGKAKDEFVLGDAASPPNTIEGVGEWTGSGFVGGAFVGLRTAASEIASLYFVGGYRYRNLGHFSGQVTSTLGNSTGSPENSDGQPIDFDFSGIYLRAGIMVGIGG